MDGADQAFAVLVIPALHSAQYGTPSPTYLRFFLHDGKDGLHGVEQAHGCYRLLVTRVGCLQNLRKGGVGRYEPHVKIR